MISLVGSCQLHDGVVAHLPAVLGRKEHCRSEQRIAEHLLVQASDAVISVGKTDSAAKLVGPFFGLVRVVMNSHLAIIGRIRGNILAQIDALPLFNHITLGVQDAKGSGRIGGSAHRHKSEGCNDTERSQLTHTR